MEESMLTIIFDKAANNLGLEMYEKIAKTQRDIKCFNLEDLNIEPCYACRGCEEKTYKRCIVRDDADLILPYIARSETFVIITPIIYGSYSFPVKRVFDKFTLIVDHHYSYRNGELTKGKTKRIKYYAIGIHDGIDMEEVNVFKQLAFETMNIAGWTGRAIVMPYDTEDYNRLVKELVGI
jgi:multimeric flavodoxin WrbA